MFFYFLKINCSNFYQQHFAPFPQANTQHPQSLLAYQQQNISHQIGVTAAASGTQQQQTEIVVSRDCSGGNVVGAGAIDTDADYEEEEETDTFEQEQSGVSREQIVKISRCLKKSQAPYIDYLKLAARNRDGIFRLCPAVFSFGIPYRPIELNWNRATSSIFTGSFGIAQFINISSFGNLCNHSNLDQEASPPPKKSLWNGADEKEKNECVLRHPYLPPCTTRVCNKRVINVDGFLAVPQLQNQSALLASLEFYWVMLDVQFIHSKNLDCSGKDNSIRMISAFLKDVTPKPQDFYGRDDDDDENDDNLANSEARFGRDITYDYMNLLTSFCRGSYLYAKELMGRQAATAELKRKSGAISRKKSQKPIVRVAFCDTSIFHYLCAAEAIVDGLKDEILYTNIYADDFSKMHIDNRLPKSVAEKLFVQTFEEARPIPEIEKLDERSNMLMNALARLSIYKNNAENVHLSYLCLVKKYLTTFCKEERQRLEHVFKLLDSEKNIYRTQFITDEKADKKMMRLSLLNLHRKIRVDARKKYESTIIAMISKFHSLYLEFICEANGISLASRIDDVLKYREKTFDDFVGHRRKQFNMLIKALSSDTKWIMPHELTVYSAPNNDQMRHYSKSDQKPRSQLRPQSRTAPYKRQRHKQVNNLKILKAANID